MAEARLKRKEVRERLNVTRYGYEQMIADGILEPAVELPHRHPFHTVSQIVRAEQKLAELSRRTVRDRPRITRPVSARMRQQFQRAQGSS